MAAYGVTGYAVRHTVIQITLRAFASLGTTAFSFGFRPLEHCDYRDRVNTLSRKMSKPLGTETSTSNNRRHQVPTPPVDHAPLIDDGGASLKVAWVRLRSNLSQIVLSEALSRFDRSDRSELLVVIDKR